MPPSRASRAANNITQTREENVSCPSENLVESNSSTLPTSGPTTQTRNHPLPLSSPQRSPDPDAPPRKGISGKERDSVVSDNVYEEGLEGKEEEKE